MSIYSKGRGFAVKVGGRSLHQPDYVIRKDKASGLLVREPCLSDSDLSYYYEHNEWWRHCFPKLFPTEVLLRDALVQNLPIDARTLDIGCGDGRFLSALPKDYNKFGTELSGGAAQAAEGRGVKIVRHEDVMAGKYGQFDAIVMLDVFEHLRDPHSFIAEVLTLLKSGGLVGVSTGDGDCEAVRNDAANFWYWRIAEHLSMWTEDYARFAEKDFRLQRIFSQRSSHYPWTWKLGAKQMIQKFSYDIFHNENYNWLRPIARLLPVVSRARNWNQRPIFWYDKDHVVTVWRKLADHSDELGFSSFSSEN